MPENLAQFSTVTRWAGARRAGDPVGKKPPPGGRGKGASVAPPWRRPPSSHIPPMIPFSVLDLSPVAEGSDAAQALRNTLDLAQHAERWGYHRYWLAEHHNMPGIASAATAVVIGHVAGGTSTIRVGAGALNSPQPA